MNAGRPVVSALFSVWAACCLSAAPAARYVAPGGDDGGDGSAARPFRTVARAVEALRADGVAAPKEIVLRDGVHELSAPVELTPKDSGLTIRAEHAGKAVLRGSVRVTGWAADPEDARFISAPFPFAPEPRVLRTLVVNGAVAELSSYPDYATFAAVPVAPGQEGSKRHFRYDAKDLPAGRDLRGLDLSSAWVSLLQNDATLRAYLATNDWRRGVVCLALDAPRPLVAGQGLKFMNLRLGMLRPGCWMYGDGRIVYWPKPGETAANVEAYVSRSAGAVRIAEGTKDVTLAGLVVEGCAGTLGGRPFAVEAPKPKVFRIAVDDCEIRHGANGGVNIVQGYDCRVRNCRLHDNGATGVALRNTGKLKKWFNDVGVKHPELTRGTIAGCEIRGNGFYNISRNGQYSSIGDQAHYEGMNIDFVGNRVCDGAGGGVSFTVLNGLFASNDIHRVMTVQRDGAGVSCYQEIWPAENVTFAGNRLYDIPGGPALQIQGTAGSRVVGNVFERTWFPLRVDQTKGLAVTGNVFDYGGPAVRCAFADTVSGCGLTGNVFRVARAVEDDASVPNLDAWENDVEVRQADGSVRRLGRVKLSRRPLPPKGEVRVPSVTAPCIISGFVNAGHMRNPSRAQACALDCDAKGLPAVNAPKAGFSAAFDAQTLSVAGSCAYLDKVRPTDSIRFRFGGYGLQLSFDGTVKAADGGFSPTPETWSWRASGRSVSFGFALPLARLGVTGNPVGAAIPFDAVLCDGAGAELARFAPPRADGAPAGTLRLTAYCPSTAGLVQPEWIYDGEGRPCGGATSPFGRVQLDCLTLPRLGGKLLRGFALRDRSDGARRGHAAMLFVPYSDGDPADGEAKVPAVVSGTMKSAAGSLALNLQDWDIHTRHVASRNAAYSQLHGWRDETLTVLVDASFAEDGKVTESRGEVLADGTLKLHNRVKGADGADYEVWGRMGFGKRAESVRELPPLAGLVGRRYLFTFNLAANDRTVVVRSAVSERSAADAEAAFAADPAATFEERAQAVARDWDRVLDTVRVDGEVVARMRLLTAVYAAYALPGADGAAFSFGTGADALLRGRVLRRGPVTEKTRLKAVRLGGKALSDLNDLPAGCFGDGDSVELELTDRAQADDETYKSTGMNRVVEATEELGADPNGLRILFVGNSITLHAPNPPVWTNNCGMAASAPEKDYAHIVVRALEKRFGRKARVKIVNYAHFERGYGSFDFSTVDKLVAFRPEVVVFALGENVGALPDEESRFAWQYAFDTLVGRFMNAPGKRPLAVVRGVFWPNAAKDAAMEAVADKYDIPFARADVVNEPGMSAKGQGFDASPGVAYHPGDRGMAEIARRLLAALFPEGGPRVSILGDSYSTYEGAVPEGNYVWYEKPPKNKNDVVRQEQCWWSIVIRNLGGKLERNESWSGAPICYKGWEKPEVVRKYAFVNRTDRLGDPELILVCGGTNDSWCKAKMGEYKYDGWTDADLNFYRPAFAKTLADLRRLHPKARILNILNSELSKDINESTHEICAHYKVPCVDLKGIDKGDRGHPTVAGMKAFAKQVTAAIGRMDGGKGRK